jgi:hypothetical protein
MQKSIVLLSDLPCIVLFSRVIKDVAAAMFDKPDVDHLSLLRSVAAELASWPAPHSRMPLQEPVLELSLLGEILEPLPLAFSDTHIPGQLVYAACVFLF